MCETKESNCATKRDTKQANAVLSKLMKREWRSWTRWTWRIRFCSVTIAAYLTSAAIDRSREAQPANTLQSTSRLQRKPSPMGSGRSSASNRITTPDRLEQAPEHALACCDADLFWLNTGSGSNSPDWTSSKQSVTQAQRRPGAGQHCCHSGQEPRAGVSAQ